MKQQIVQLAVLLTLVIIAASPGFSQASVILENHLDSAARCRESLGHGYEDVVSRNQECLGARVKARLDE